MSTRLNWRFLLGEFVVIVLGVLVALWVDQEQASRRDALLEVEYLESFLIDLDTDLAQFDSADATKVRVVQILAFTAPSGRWRLPRCAALP